MDGCDVEELARTRFIQAVRDPTLLVALVTSFTIIFDKVWWRLSPQATPFFHSIHPPSLPTNPPFLSRCGCQCWMKTATLLRQQRCSSALIIDTDVGYDDLVAIHSLLQPHGKERRSLALPLLLTTVGGMNEPLIGAQCLSSLFPKIPVAPGSNTETPSSSRTPPPTWLTQFRNNFQTLAKKQGFLDAQQAIRDSTADRVKDLLQNVPKETSVHLLCLGPLTNLAHWIAQGVLSLDDETTCKIKSVWIMGGNDCWNEETDSRESTSTIGNAGGGTIMEPEFNFQQDPAAVRDVLTCPALQGKLHLVTTRCTGNNEKDDGSREKAFQELQAKCRNIRVDAGDSSSSKSMSLVAELVASMPQKHLYDPVCAFAHAMPRHVQMRKREFCVSTETALLVPVSTASAKSPCTSPVVEALVLEDFDFDAFCLWIENGLC